MERDLLIALFIYKQLQDGWIIKKVADMIDTYDFSKNNIEQRYNVPFGTDNLSILLGNHEKTELKNNIL